MGTMETICVGGMDNAHLSQITKRSIRIFKDKQTGDRIYKILTTDKLYNIFEDIIKNKYPNVCDFDIFD